MEIYIRTQLLIIKLYQILYLRYLKGQERQWTQQKNKITENEIKWKWTDWTQLNWSKQKSDEIWKD